MACIDVRGATLTVPQGNDKTWAITATNPDGTSKDMTGYTLVLLSVMRLPMIFKRPRY